MPKPKFELKGILFPTLSLFLICFVITAALAGVNAITKGPIAANEKLAADLAREEIFAQASFEDCGDYYVARKDGELLGYCVNSEARGYGGVIQAAVGLDLQGAVIKVQVVACDGETPGLGQKVKEESFLKQFVGRRDTSKFDAIASATYSSKGVADAVNMALEIFREQIQ